MHPPGTVAPRRDLPLVPSHSCRSDAEHRSGRKHHSFTLAVDRFEGGNGGADPDALLPVVRPVPDDLALRAAQVGRRSRVCAAIAP